VETAAPELELAITEVVAGLPLVHEGSNQSRISMMGFAERVLEARQDGPGHSPGSKSIERLKSIRGGMRELEVVAGPDGNVIVVLTGDAKLDGAAVVDCEPDVTVDSDGVVVVLNDEIRLVATSLLVVINGTLLAPLVPED
jgi:hypothetical protein